LNQQIPNASSKLLLHGLYLPLRSRPDVTRQLVQWLALRGL
jgi:hypothetical protein